MLANNNSFGPCAVSASRWEWTRHRAGSGPGPTTVDRKIKPPKGVVSTADTLGKTAGTVRFRDTGIRCGTGIYTSGVPTSVVMVLLAGLGRKRFERQALAAGGGPDGR